MEPTRTAKAKRRKYYGLRKIKTFRDKKCTSFTVCATLVLLFGTKSDIFGECSFGDEILDADKPIPVEHVEGVMGSRGKLPCDVRVPNRDDKLHMVLWFRDDAEPIYRYDVRDKPLTDAKRSSVWGDRLYFQTMSDPAHLSIQDLQMVDEGMYRCRVDFKNSPTRNAKINLSIIVPPDTPVIVMNDANGILASNQVGPYNEGSALRLTCEVSGGRPKPRLKWWLENEMIDGDDEVRNDGIVVNTLSYPQLRRHHLNSKFVCQASNTHLAPPKSATAIVNLNLRPLEVNITTKDANLVADKRYDIECVSGGSRPHPATISWWKNSRQIKKPPITPDSEDQNITRSILSFTPMVDDDGKILTCRAENHWIPGSAIEDRWRLNIHYSPKVTLQLGANMVADDIKEGDDVYFECSVRSNPQYTRLSWFQNGKELRHNTSQGVVMSSTRLVLQKINRHTAGNYSCSSQNSEGATLSNAVLLRVKYVPTCKAHTESLVGAMKQETITVVCEMASDPPSVQFSWTFNNSGSEVIHVPQHRYTSSGTTSILTYTPTNEMDFGTMTCWGSNLVGKGMAGPCYFQIVSAGRPFPPKNCSMFNKTEDSLSIACLEGFNGGLPQHFVLEVVDLQAKKIKLNASYKIPTFSVEGMEPGVVFRFIIYSVNDKGRSEPFILDGITFRGVAKLTGSTEDAEINPIFAVLVGCVLVLVVVLSVAIVAIWKRSRRKKPPLARAYKRENGNGEANFQTEQSALTKIENGLEDIGNPDVVPNKNGKDRSSGIRGFIRIHKTPPARRRKKDLEVKNNGETVALTLVETPDGELHRNHNHKSSLLTSSNHSSTPRESRI